MNRMIFISVVILFVPVAGYSVGMDPCQWMQSADDVCKKVIRGAQYEINIDGQIKYTKDELTITSTLNLPEYFYIDSVSFEVFDGVTYLNCGITDDDAGSAIIAQFNPNNKKLIWQYELGTFNSSNLLINKNYIYVGGLGTIAKIRAIDGTVVWKHSDLYQNDTQAFNSFSKAYKEGNNIIFEENKVRYAKYKGVKKIIVDDESGEIYPHNKKHKPTR